MPNTRKKCRACRFIPKNLYKTPKHRRQRGGVIDATRTMTAVEPEERMGVLDMIGDSIKQAAASAAETAENAGLKVLGLERVGADVAANGAPSAIGNAATGAISGVNSVLESSEVHNSVVGTAKETAEIASGLLGDVNRELNNPEVKREVGESLRNAGEYGSMLVEAGREPFNKAVDVAAEAIPRATGAAISGAIKVGTDALGAIPGVGGIIEIGKIINDGSRAASAVVQAGSEIAEAGSDMMATTAKNMDEQMQELQKHRDMGQRITQRTHDSIQRFRGGGGSVATTKKRRRRKM